MAYLSPNSPRRTTSIESIGQESLSRTLTVSNDGYDYTDAGVAPEDTPTTGRQATRQQGTEPPTRDPNQLPSSRRVPDDTLRLWTRWIDGGWRPKIPDEESAIAEPLPVTAGDISVPTKTPSTVHNPNIRDFEIMHNWTPIADHDESVFHLNVVHRIAGEGQTASSRGRASIEGHIRWIHSEESSMTHARFQDLISGYAFRHVDSGVRDLTRRLLKRVWATDEKEFIGGKFLNPATTRYDGQSKHDDEKPCTFFNFPYFSVEKPRIRMDNTLRQSGPKLDHPVRTLLQSRYRLEATEGRDQDQSISKLSRSEIKTCIRSPEPQNISNMDNELKPIIHVPQLWCLSLSGDVMVTSGSISEKALRGSVVMTKDTNVQLPQAGHGPPLVRIFLEHFGKQQSFLYPTDQCDWWFGLLNKQRQILRSLGENGTTKVRFGEYKFYTTSGASGKSLVDIHNWHDTLKKEKSEKLDLWMKNTVTVPDLTLTTDTSDVEMKIEQATESPEVRRGDTNVLSATQGTSTVSKPLVPHTAQPDAPTSGGTISARTSENAIDRANASYVFTGGDAEPFFEWPFLNDEGKLDKRSPKDKVSLWLRRIYGTLQDRYGAMISEARVKGGPTQVSSPQSTVNDGARKISPCSSADAYARLIQPEMRESKLIDEMKLLCVESEQLFRLFVPVPPHSASTRTSGSHTSTSHSKNESSQATAATTTAESPAVGIYWGTVETIVSCLGQNECVKPEMDGLVQGLRQTISGARELHFGMRSLRSVRADPHDGSDKSNTDIRLLLEVIVDAFEAVFGILFGAVTYLWAQADGPDGSSNKISDFIGDHVRESCRLLGVAKARLIVEADEINHDKGLGPVVTPEAIIIMLLERLSQGVYQNATIDIMDLYEKIVEKIALRVEHSASRRLLLEINRVSEELDIINDVLTQQKSVLIPFRESLDPDTFKAESIPRKMRFQYESKSVDKILKAINESIIDCTELRQRASRLAIQNVQLVETKLEDNSKAIIVFTVVTIFFLPLTFVTGFFGMNLVGISATKSTVKHFWVIALPVTFGVVLLCLFAAFLGSIKRWIQRHEKRRKEKST